MNFLLKFQMVRALRLKFLTILLIASHAKAGSIPTDEAIASVDHDSSSSLTHGTGPGGSSETVLEVPSLGLHVSHSSQSSHTTDFGDGSIFDHLSMRADHEPVQIVVDDLVRNSEILVKSEKFVNIIDHNHCHFTETLLIFANFC